MTLNPKYERLRIGQAVVLVGRNIEDHCRGSIGVIKRLTATFDPIRETYEVQLHIDCNGLIIQCSDLDVKEIRDKSPKV